MPAIECAVVGSATIAVASGELPVIRVNEGSLEKSTATVSLAPAASFASLYVAGSAVSSHAGIGAKRMRYVIPPAGSAAAAAAGMTMTYVPVGSVMRNAP